MCGMLAMLSGHARAEGDTTFVTQNAAVLLDHSRISIFPDITQTLPFQKIRTLTAFRHPRQSIPNLGVTSATVWFRFTLFNQSNEQRLLVSVRNANLNQIRLYYPVSNRGNYTYAEGGDLIPQTSNQYGHQHNLFEVPIPPYSYRTLYLRVNSNGQIEVPIYAGTFDHVIAMINRDDVTFGIYAGIILIMIFYNLFLYFTVRDKSYLYYIGFIFFVGFAQFCLQGQADLLWGASSFMTLRSVNWSIALAGIATLLFSRVFLRTRERTPVFDKVLVGFIIMEACTIMLTLFGAYNVSYILLDIIAFLYSFALWGIAIKFTLDGFRPAKFFLIAWSFYLLSVILYVVKDFGVIPYNSFTANILLIGSSVEIALLSFALADTINVFRKEKELSQIRALEASREKEQFVKEQNTILESRINERTYKLQQLNMELKTALDHLKHTQSQLVDAEKMASLGQLTAGIAHEINNPINFVKSNIKPLQLDIFEIKKLIKEYEQINAGNLSDKLDEIRQLREKMEFEYIMQEIDTLLTGIEDGATRTADIVKGLRSFSRVHEAEVKEADIHEGIDTTLMLLSNIVPPNLEIVKNYGKLPKVSCYPGKLNQVFMNILTNSIQAVKSKPHRDRDRITITTKRSRNQVVISMADTGPGIPEDVRVKIFDPFFTTKGVGEGTGLGLSIVYTIIEKHSGKIEVVSQQGKGAEFILTLPIKHPELARDSLSERVPTSNSSQ
jgi:signal transduction histidine kinase